MNIFLLNVNIYGPLQIGKFQNFFVCKHNILPDRISKILLPSITFSFKKKVVFLFLFKIVLLTENRNIKH